MPDRTQGVKTKSNYQHIPIKTISCMKKNLRHIRLFGTAFLACLFGAACQDDIDTGSNDGQAPVQTAEGYVKVDINLPVTTGVGTRAVSYDNGAVDEYRVNDAIIVFFEGTSESDAIFKKAYQLNLAWNNVNESGQVTTTSHPYVTEAPKATEGKSIYALMVLNPNNVLEVQNGQLIKDQAVVFTSTQNTVSALQTKLADQKVNDYITKGSGEDATSSFFMTSAPLSSMGSGATSFPTGATASILTKVKVYDKRTEAEAIESTADQIYVERIVAKVSMDVTDGIINEEQSPVLTNATIVNVSSDAYEGDYVELQGWALNVTNKSTKLVRDVSDFETWMGYTTNSQCDRFVETAEVKTNAAKFRINWAVDGNYNETVASTEFNIWNESNEEKNEVDWESDFTDDNSNMAYCFENTFSTTNMLQNQTTSVLIKGKYNHVSTEGKEESFFIVGDQSGAFTEEEFISFLKQQVNGLEGMKIEINSDVDGGYYNVEKESHYLGNLLIVKNSSGELQDVAGLNSVVATIGEVKYYKNGETYYYTSLIRHFSDEETQWENDEEYTDAKHLGRYGVVRNTWYKLTINSISGPGEPEIPEPGPDPDDEHKGFIKMEVNILAWAVRNNGIDL